MDSILLVTIFIIIAMCGTFFMIFFGYRARKAPILKLFNSMYFTFEIINPAGISTLVNKTSGDFKVFGKVIFFKHKDAFYRVMEDMLYFRNKIPSSIYKFGNPIPINIREHKDVLVKVWDEDSKTFEENNLSAQELYDAIQSKVVHDLNKFTYNKMEMISIIIGIVSIIMSIIVIYEVTQVNSEFNSLVNQLNQILKTLPTVSNPPAAGAT